MFTSAAYPGSTAWRPSTSQQQDTGGPDGSSSTARSDSGLTPQQVQEHHRISVMRALLGKFPQPLRLQVSIPYATAVYSVGGVYISYCMQLRDEVNDVIWQSSHRYSEYRSLHLHLGRSFASGFPPVLLRNKSNRSKREIEHRRVKLETYMRRVVTGVLEAYAGNLQRWASQHATKIVTVAAAEAARHKTGRTTTNNTANNLNAVANAPMAGYGGMHSAFVGGEGLGGSSATSRAASPEPVPSTGRLSAVALQQYMAQLHQQRQQGVPRAQADESHVDPSGGMFVGASAETSAHTMGGGAPRMSADASYSALVSMIPASMPPYLAQLTQLLRFISHPFLDDWENVTFLAAPTHHDDDRLSMVSESIGHGRTSSPTGTGSNRSRSFDGARSNSSSASSVRSMASSHISNGSNTPAPHPSAVATRWRPPTVLPGLRLGLSMPLVTVSMSIESVWEAHVKGDKGTKKGQLRHRYDEASAICAHIASREHIMDSLQMQEFIMEFRRKHPIQAYLRFEKVLENHTPHTASRSDRGNKPTSRNNSRSSSSRGITDDGSAPMALSELEEDAGGVLGGDGDDMEVGSPISRHHRSIAGGSSDSIHESFPDTLALATQAAGGAGVLYDPSLDEATASMARAQAEENATLADGSVGLNASIASTTMRAGSAMRSNRHYPQGAAAEHQFLDSIGMHFTLRPDYNRFSLQGVRDAKEQEKRRRSLQGVSPIQSFMPRRSISILEGATSHGKRSSTPMPTHPSTVPTSTFAAKRGSAMTPPAALTLGSGGLTASAGGGTNSLSTSGPSGRTLPFRDAPVPTACAEYIARIRGMEVDDCRCTEGQFCSNATAAPVADDDGASDVTRVELGDVYVTQSGYSIVVCPPPVPKPGHGAGGKHGSCRD